MYSGHLYGVEDGIPSTEVYCAIQDSSGFMWFGTEGGISKFNGYEFTNYTTQNGLTDNTIFFLYLDFEGKIWYLSFTGGIGYFKNDSIHPYAYKDKLIETIQPGNNIETIEINPNGKLNFSTALGGSGSIDSKGNIEFQLYSKTKSNQLIVDQQNNSLSIEYYRYKGYSELYSKMLDYRNIITGSTLSIQLEQSLSKLTKIFPLGNNEFLIKYGTTKTDFILYIKNDKILNKKILKDDGGCVVMENGDKLSVSRRRKDALYKRLLEKNDSQQWSA